MNDSSMKEALDCLRELKDSGLIKAVGEMGLDTTKPVSLEIQSKVLLNQVEIAHPFPQILHIRGHKRDWRDSLFTLSCFA